MKRHTLYAALGAATAVAAYGAVVYTDRGSFTREAVVMIGVLIVAGLAFVLGIAALHRTPRRKRAEVTLIPKRHR